MNILYYLIYSREIGIVLTLLGFIYYYFKETKGDMKQTVYYTIRLFVPLVLLFEIGILAIVFEVIFGFCVFLNKLLMNFFNIVSDVEEYISIFLYKKYINIFHKKEFEKWKKENEVK